jgi:carbamoyl-phosphate synthase large subunit
MKRPGPRPHKKLNILFTCIGRRVSLLECFRAAAKQIKINAIFMGADINQLSPALQLCDKNFLVKPTYHRDYIKELLRIVSANHIDLLVPTVDLDLKLLSQNKHKFAERGCYVLVSSAHIIEICQDKRKTFSFLHKNGFDTPLTMSPRAAMATKKLKFPCFLKPWDGFASRGNAVVKNRKELEFYSKRIPNCIVQEFIPGTEYTCDVFVDFDMKARCVVPRKRIEVRGGEVSKGQVVKNRRIMVQTAKLVELLGAGPGVITLQLFLDKKRKIKFIEINPRFGGGVPLSIKAGANFPKWILQQLLGRKANIKSDGFTDGLTMLRYDGEVWVQTPL